LVANKRNNIIMGVSSCQLLVTCSLKLGFTFKRFAAPVVSLCNAFSYFHILVENNERMVNDLKANNGNKENLNSHYFTHITHHISH
jgi:hypothetical protein